MIRCEFVMTVPGHRAVHGLAPPGTVREPRPAGGYPPAVLAAADVSFLLVGSAALWLRGEPVPVGDADVVVEPAEPNIRRLRAALSCLAIRPRAVPPVPSLVLLPLVTVTTSYGKIDCLLERGRWTGTAAPRGRRPAGCRCRGPRRLGGRRLGPPAPIQGVTHGAIAAVPAWSLPLREIRDCTSRRDYPFGRLVCIPEAGTSPEQLRDQLMGIYGVTTTVPAALPGPLPALVRRWARRYPGEDLLASLTALENAVRSQRNGRE
jgi:hypothetical protein